jgi:hypothetical protein
MEATPTVTVPLRMPVASSATSASRRTGSDGRADTPTKPTLQVLGAAGQSLYLPVYTLTLATTGKCA